MPEVLACDAKIVGLAQIKSLVEALQYPSVVRVLLGDNDFAVMDGCSEWCAKDWGARLKRDIDQLVPCVERAVADLRSPNTTVLVQKWSEIYDPQRVSNELLRAEAILPERDSDLVAESMDMYLEQWKYRRVGALLRVPPSQMRAFILGDIIRTAAQYRVEANIAREVGAIQLWCEAVPNSSWPIRLSNYDGAGFAAGLMMI